MNKNDESASQIPAELGVRPTRMVRRRGIPWSVIGVRLFLLPLTIAGLVLLFIVIGEPIIMLITPVLRGEVTDINATHSSKGGTTWHVDYAYWPNGRISKDQRFGSDQIADDESRQLHRGDPISVYAASVGTHYYAFIGRSPGAYILHRAFLWVFALFWNSVMAVLIFLSWGLPMRRKKLVRDGEAVVGKITGKSVSGDKSTIYRLKFRFITTSPQSVVMNADMTVSSAQYESVREGEPTVILYDPDRPKRNVIYAFSGFVAEKF